MDYTGFGRDGRHDYKRDYKINRPLTKEERQRRLKKTEQASADPQDWLSVIKLNSTYLELVDRWYPVRGFAAWEGGVILAIASGAIGAFLWLAIAENDFARWISFAMVAAIFSVFVWIGYKGMRFDIFRQTHYPIRFNRRTRQVYVTRPSDTVLIVSWDDLFICAQENDLPLFTSSVDVRAHVLAEDGESVKDTFTLGYPFLGDKVGLMRLWEYIRRYMEDPDGVEKNYELTKLCLPIDGRREGFAFGLVRTFAPYTKWPVLQLLASPLWTMTTLGRCLAMYTSKVPAWPAEVEAACQVDPDDPYQKDWRQNGKYDFYELGWPVICFVVGLVVLVTGIAWLLSLM
ncbi:phage holin family protein [Luteimonas sp. RD2P54]|uniref:Phage holin family protein n=1 Tax=Luteimonas endophytica TaxID=3042023 RepID=A0ABT6J6A5_9GAMM|nr:phage holin family protein [Luteimonas endophytica]MDH5822336.1 phage holin family protein [Luteimonas endophytica]